MKGADAYWFPAKRTGWGWGLPTRWQGWVVMLAYLGVLAVATRWLPPALHPWAFTGLVTVATIGLLGICLAKGEPQRTRDAAD